MTAENDKQALTAICKAANSGYLLQVIADGSFDPVVEKDLSHWPDWPTFPAEAAHAAGCELVLLGYMVRPETVTADSLMGWHAVPDQRAWSAKVGSFAEMRAAGI
ncbi:hypothetical protein ACYCCF_30380 [Streptomyces argenteolus]|uniref:hypothetical protein n=1 Tax=Streptomyces sp. NPDC025273 TaxID=3155251 RepID=UPI0033CBE530